MLALTSPRRQRRAQADGPRLRGRATVDALGMDPLEAQIRQVFFFDTPDLALNKVGVVVRARRVQGRGDDTVVKLRPIVPDQLHPSRAQGQDHGRGGRRHAGRLCLLGLLQGLPRSRRRRQAGRRRRPGDPQAVLQGAAGLLRHPRPRGAGPGRPVGPRADQRVQAEVHPQGVQPAHGGRAVAVPGRGADPGAVDQVRPEARASRSPPRVGRSWPIGASTCTASSRPRPRPPWTTSPRTSRRAPHPGDWPGLACCSIARQANEASRGRPMGAQSSASPRPAGPILLRTKLCPPPVRAGLVPRARLDGLLKTGAKGRLCLVDAPAGSGKTTLLAQWWRAEPGHPAGRLAVAGRRRRRPGAVLVLRRRGVPGGRARPRGGRARPAPGLGHRPTSWPR